MHQRTSLALIAATGLLAACAGGSDEQTALACTDLTTAKLGIANLQVASAAEVAASGPLPAHCKLNGALNARTGIDGKPDGSGAYTQQ